MGLATLPTTTALALRAGKQEVTTCFAADDALMGTPLTLRGNAKVCKCHFIRTRLMRYQSARQAAPPVVFHQTPETQRSAQSVQMDGRSHPAVCASTHKRHAQTVNTITAVLDLAPREFPSLRDAKLTFRCSPACATCIGPGANDCLTCNSPRINFMGSCVGYSFSDGVCETALSAAQGTFVADNERGACNSE